MTQQPIFWFAGPFCSHGKAQWPDRVHAISFRVLSHGQQDSLWLFKQKKVYYRAMGRAKLVGGKLSLDEARRNGQPFNEAVLAKPTDAQHL